MSLSGRCNTQWKKYNQKKHNFLKQACEKRLKKAVFKAMHSESSQQDLQIGDFPKNIRLNIIFHGMFPIQFFFYDLFSIQQSLFQNFVSSFLSRQLLVIFQALAVSRTLL